MKNTLLEMYRNSLENIEKASSCDSRRKAEGDNELVLDDPKPRVTFDSFGDNSLLLTLHCFIDSVDNRILTKSILHQVNDQKFRVAKISMAFP